MGDLVGKKVKGFAFQSGPHTPGFAPAMKDYIGVEGEIINVYSGAISYATLQFPDGLTWDYPLETVKRNLLYNFIKITTSTPMLCSDNEEQWLQDDILCQLPDGTYLSKDLYSWKYVKPLNETV